MASLGTIVNGPALRVAIGLAHRVPKLLHDIGVGIPECLELGRRGCRTESPMVGRSLRSVHWMSTSNDTATHGAPRDGAGVGRPLLEEARSHTWVQAQRGAAPCARATTRCRHPIGMIHQRAVIG